MAKKTKLLHVIYYMDKTGRLHYAAHGFYYHVKGKSTIERSSTYRKLRDDFVYGNSPDYDAIGWTNAPDTIRLVKGKPDTIKIISI